MDWWLALRSPGKVDGIFAPVRLFPVLGLALFACMALSYPLSDTDIWWHLAAGREICRTGHLLWADHFCLSSLGAPWTDLHWGFQLAVWKLWTLLGNRGLVFLRIALPLAAVLVAMGRRLSWPTAWAACLGIWILRPFVDARPLLFSLFLLATIQFALEASPRWGKRVAALSILGCQVFLVNVQGLFLLGPLLVAGYATGDWLEGRRRDALEKFALVAGMLLASLANPYGFHAFDLAVRIAGRIAPVATNPFSSEIPENAPLWNWIADDPRRLVPLAWFASAVAVLWRPGAGSRGRTLLLAGTAILAAIAVRNLPLLCLEAAFCVDPSRRNPLIRIWTISASAVVASLLLVSAFQKRWDLGDSWIAPFRLPGNSALSRIRASDAPVFHEVRAGGWIWWNSDIAGRCWADTRLVLHDQEFLSGYLDVVDHPGRFPAYSKRWNFGFALLPVVEFPRFHPLAAFLMRSPDWTLVDCDGAWALFRRRDADGIPRDAISADSISAWLTRRFDGNPLLESEAREATLSFFRAGGRDDLARAWTSLR